LAIATDDVGFLVKPDIAARQLEAETRPPKPPPEPGGKTEGSDTPEPAKPEKPPTQQPAKQFHRFHGSVRIDSERVGRDAGRIADEIIAHLVGQVGAEVTVTLDIEAQLPNGASDSLVRTVTENSRTLKFDSHGFEME
jgi:hypothetical protein